MNRILFIIISITLFQGCAPFGTSSHHDTLISIHTIDTNGFSETIHTENRLRKYAKTDFLHPQPFQKVLCSFSGAAGSPPHAIVTTYYPSSSLKQYLEIVNGHASGFYREWHPNTTLKLEASVIGGEPDITPTAEESWIFDGMTKAWNDSGSCIAEIPYHRGATHGESKRYYPSGVLKEVITYDDGVPHGTARSFRPNGTLIAESAYRQGLQHGLSSVFSYDGSSLLSHETFDSGKLETGIYHDTVGNLISEITDGDGYRVIYHNDAIAELHHYQHGSPEGTVKVFTENGILVRSYTVKNGKRHGEEIEYYPLSQQQKLSITWFEDAIQGVSKTWYDNGASESSREMSGNKKNGISSAWYANGDLMLVEEYDNDRLIKGRYYRKGSTAPSSQVDEGKGTATLYDPEGAFLKKISYSNGTPLLP